MTINPGTRVHLELRRDTFVLYTEGGSQRLEVPYADADEIVSHLTKVIGSDAYLTAPPQRPSGSGDGHLLNDSPRKLRPAEHGRKKMRPVCQRCGGVVPYKIAELSQKEFGYYLCRTCYVHMREQLFSSVIDHQDSPYDDDRG